jgi:arrestin-related trafficking adapter 3/6
MQYLIAISGRSFPIGSVIPFSITFVPWTKMKVFRLSVVIEGMCGICASYLCPSELFLERIEYYTDFKRLVRSDPVTRVVLFSLKDANKEHPLLPLHSDNLEAFKSSALGGTFTSEDDLSEAISNLMGPGPWTIQKDIPLPTSCNELHFTNKNKKSNIIISHTLKVIFRVQRGDDQEIDPQTGKRKMFDIVVQTPIHILSVSSK